MSVIFYKELGFSKTDIGLFSKGFGWITTIIFTLLGGIFTIRAGIFKAIFIAGIFMALTNILFSFLAWSGKNYELFAIAVILDDIAALLQQLLSWLLFLLWLIEIILQLNMRFGVNWNCRKNNS